MRKLIARLIRCGMPREVALAVARTYRKDLRNFELYVEQVEDECHEPMDEI